MYSKGIKRILDFLAALFGLLLISPVFIVVMLCLIYYNKGNAFFLQDRPGLRGKIFRVIKFKSMTDAKDENGNLLPNEQRITAIGKFIRKTSLDELPQLINVLKGDMSLIGPRPLRVDYLPIYSVEQARRHDVRPGITGWAQVNGRNAISWTEKFRLDVWYVDHISFMLDIKILYMTLLKVLKRADINSSEDTIGVEKFNGKN